MKQKFATEQRNRGSGYVYDVNMNEAGLDQFINNPTMSYQSVNVNDIVKQVANVSSAYATQIMSDPYVENTNSGKYLHSKVKKGFSPVEIITAIENDESAPKELKDLVTQRDSIIDSFGINN